MTARWRDEAGKSHSGVVDLQKPVFDALKPGDDIALLLRKDDQSVAMVAGFFDSNFLDRPITILGVSTTGIGFLGVLLALCGIGLASGLLKPKA